jgi:hypothetical protein
MVFTVLYHVSAEVLVDLVLQPRVPSITGDGEDKQIPRVCLSPFIEGAISAIEPWSNQTLHLYAAYNVNAYIPTQNQVPDRELTGEVWSLDSIELTHLGIIELQGQIYANPERAIKLEDVDLINKIDNDHIFGPTYLYTVRLDKDKPAYTSDYDCMTVIFTDKIDGKTQRIDLDMDINNRYSIWRVCLEHYKGYLKSQGFSDVTVDVTINALADDKYRFEIINDKCVSISTTSDTTNLF